MFPQRRDRSWLSGAALVLVLATHAALLAYSAVVHSPTYDEGMHLAGGLRRLLEGRFDVDIGSPPLSGIIQALPAAAVGAVTDWRGAPDAFAVGRDLAVANGPRILWLVMLARCACIPFALLGGYVSFRWARELFGVPSGWLALTLWCACPNIVGHGALATADMAATSLGLMAWYTFWRWLRSPGWERAVAAGLSLGLAESTKYVWVPLYLLWPLAWSVWAWRAGAQPAPTSWRRQAVQLAVIGVLSVYIINCAYLFEESCQPLKQFRFGADALCRLGVARPDSPLNRVGSAPVPLPANYVRGIDAIERRFDEKHRSYLHGEWSERRWWHYYLTALMVKIPLGTWLVGLLAAGVTLADRRYNSHAESEFGLLAVACFFVAFVTVATPDQAHVRYVIPALPFLFIWASKTARAFELRARPVAAIVAVSLGWSVTSSLSTYPHSLSYFNELAGGPRHGHDWLLNSNIDWGQDLTYLKRWLDAHPGARPLHLAYFGSIDPRLAGIEFTLPPRVKELASRADGSGATNSRSLSQGVYAISVNLLRGTAFPVYTGSGELSLISATDYTYFRRFQPVATAGYSIYIYELDQRDIDSVTADIERQRSLHPE